jgi:hypothetical protein
MLTADQMQMADDMAKSVEEHTAARFLLCKGSGPGRGRITGENSPIRQACVRA